MPLEFQGTPAWHIEWAGGTALSSGFGVWYHCSPIGYTFHLQPAFQSVVLCPIPIFSQYVKELVLSFLLSLLKQIIVFSQAFWKLLQKRSIREQPLTYLVKTKTHMLWESISPWFWPPSHPSLHFLMVALSSTAGHMFPVLMTKFTSAYSLIRSEERGASASRSFFSGGKALIATGHFL